MESHANRPGMGAREFQRGLNTQNATVGRVGYVSRVGAFGSKQTRTARPMALAPEKGGGRQRVEDGCQFVTSEFAFGRGKNHTVKIPSSVTSRSASETTKGTSFGFRTQG